MSSIEQDASHLADLLRRYDHDRYLLALFVPAAARDAVRAVFAFNSEIARIAERVSEPMLGQIRLQWWRDGIAALYRGAPPPRHEVLAPLARAVGRHHLSQEHFQRLIDARERDLSGEAPATLAALESYAEESSAPLQFLVLEALGAAGGGANRAARAGAIAYALSGLLRAAPFRARAGRAVLPQDLVSAAGFDVAALVKGRSDPALAGIARQVAARARHHLAEARALRRQLPRPALPALLPARLAAADLARLERAQFDLLAPAFLRPDPWRAWRLAAAALIARY